MRAILVSIFLCVIVSACGFQLRGDADLPSVMDRTFIAYRGSDGDVRRAITRALTLSGASVVTTPEEATATLRVHRAAASRRVLARDRRGRPREYEINVLFRYDVVDPEGDQLVPLQDVERQSNLLLDPSDPLTNRGDINYTVQTLREDALWEMLRRISATIRLPVEEA